MSESTNTSDINQPGTPPPAAQFPGTGRAAATGSPAQPSRPASSGSVAQREIVRSIHYTLSYLVANPQQGPVGAIVLLHDFPGEAASWEPLLPALAATGRAVYAFDMLGFGQSDKPWPADTTNWGHADCLTYAFQRLGLRDITLVGVGLGGGVAQTLATRLYREGVARLALINSYAYQYAFAPNWPFPDMVKHQDPEFAHHMTVAEAQDELRQTIPLASAKGLSASRLTAYLEAWNSDLGKNLVMQQARNMLPLYLNAVSTDLILLERPLLLIWGERDEVTPIALGRRIASEARDARLEVVPGAGHLILDDAPDAVASQLVAFMRQI